MSLGAAASKLELSIPHIVMLNLNQHLFDQNSSDKILNVGSAEPPPE